MTVAVWVIFGLVALFWTGGAWLTAELVQWVSVGLASGGATDLGQVVAEWPLPNWVGLIGEPAWIYAAKDAVVWGLKTLPDTLPWAGSVMAWLVPLIWTLWGLGVVLMLGLAGGLHLLVRRAPSLMPRGA